MQNNIHGIFTPLVTPIREDESPDLESLSRLVTFQIESGVQGLWAMGTTSEFASFDEEERALAVRTITGTTNSRVPVIVNVSDASTRGAIRHAVKALESGASAIAATPPYYYPHSQDELVEHYRAIRNAVDLPLYIYNIPQTVRVKVELATARSLAAERTVNGIKDSQNDLEWLRQLILFVRGRDIPFSVFAGTRYLIDTAVSIGADGAIPSMANAFPELCIAAYDAARSGNYAVSAVAEARIIEIESAASGLSLGSRNAAVIGLLKAALHARGIITRPHLTLPLRTPTLNDRSVLLAKVQGPVPAWN